MHENKNWPAPGETDRIKLYRERYERGEDLYDGIPYMPVAKVLPCEVRKRSAEFNKMAKRKAAEWIERREAKLQYIRQVTDRLMNDPDRRIVRVAEVAAAAKASEHSVRRTIEDGGKYRYWQGRIYRR